MQKKQNDSFLWKKIDFLVYVHIHFKNPAKVVSWNIGVFKNE